MERSNLLRPNIHDKSFLFSVPRKANVALRAWRSRRRTIEALNELSAEQTLDCGIEAPRLDKPSVEVAASLMHKLMAMR
jgi:uncharacterized protein YjiS (DUF1127 family)